MFQSERLADSVLAQPFAISSTQHQPLPFEDDKKLCPLAALSPFQVMAIKARVLGEMYACASSRALVVQQYEEKAFSGCMIGFVIRFEFWNPKRFPSPSSLNFSSRTKQAN
jgi:hypothetical protein